jgi:hypothetical protein
MCLDASCQNAVIFIRLSAILSDFNIYPQEITSGRTRIRLTPPDFFSTTI